MDLHYFGTDISSAGHYFFILKGNHFCNSRVNFKDLPFNPEGLPLSKTNGDVETFLITDFKRGKFYCILAICGSPVDRRGGCKSVFWIEGGDMKTLDTVIRETPVAMEIINKMPFNVEGFKDSTKGEDKIN